MPAFRNLKARRSSGRIWNKPAIAYDQNGWEITPYTDLSFTIYNEVSSPHSSATSPSIVSVDSEFEAYPVRKFKGKAKANFPSDSDAYVPRPKNAFILFRSYFYQTCGGSDQNQISVDAGKAWRALPDEQKKPFQLAADREKQEHQAKFPHYTYSPGSKLGAVRRKNFAAKKKKTQPSAKTSLVVAQSACRDSRRPSRTNLKAAPTPVAVPPPVLPSLVPSSQVISEIDDQTVELTNNTNNTSQSERVFSAHWSFATAFIPTSEIPVLELSPVKSEKEGNKGMNMKGLKPPSSLRPPNFDISNEPFCLNPRPTTVGSYLDTISIPDLHYDYDETLEQLLNPPLTSSSDSETSFPLELSDVECPVISEVINDELDFSVVGVEDLGMGDNGGSEPSLLPFLPGGPVVTSVNRSSLFEYCEMDQYVDYNECDA